MLTRAEIKATKEELQVNYRRLNQPEATVLADLEMNAERLDAVLNMEHPDPSDVWEVRDYLEDKLKEQGIEMVPFSRLGDHSANHWFPYQTPWRKEELYD
ncbi:DUF2316 family protein [Limosilactobacillus fermentum]|nr:DUF2316 family protein [Limosilactobacillus fermentum]WNY95749.1 DUF2316 family protein [Limosilactobacillus fermentum]